MSDVNDLGNYGNQDPIHIEINEPVFHEEWEGSIFAMTVAMLASGYFNVDEVRRATKEMPIADFLEARYYEKFLFGLENILNQKDVLTRDEIDTGRSIRHEGGVTLPPVPPEMLQFAMTNPMPANLDLDIPQKFRIGDEIIAKNINPSQQIRLPHYIRGKFGVIEMHHGGFLLPDTHALGGPDKPQHVYNVRFSLSEIWKDENTSNDNIYIDLFADYMVLKN